MLEGLAPDGGLYVPETFEPWRASELARLPERQLTEIAYRALRPYTRPELDAAICEAVVAEALGGTESNFAGMMTRQARELGMTLKVTRDTQAGGREDYEAKLILVRPDQYVANILPLDGFVELSDYFKGVLSA